MVKVEMRDGESVETLWAEETASQTLGVKPSPCTGGLSPRKRILIQDDDVGEEWR
jgi:hypothetical protein